MIYIHKIRKKYQSIFMQTQTNKQNGKEEEQREFLLLRRLGGGSWGFPPQSLQHIRRKWEEEWMLEGSGRRVERRGDSEFHRIYKMSQWKVALQVQGPWLSEQPKQANQEKGYKSWVPEYAKVLGIARAKGALEGARMPEYAPEILNFAIFGWLFHRNSTWHATHAHQYPWNDSRHVGTWS